MVPSQLDGFLAAYARPVDDGSRAPVEAALEALLAAAGELEPLGLTRADLAAHVGAVTPDDLPVAASLARVRARELAVALGCARGHAAALAELEAHAMGPALAALQRAGFAAHDAADALQEARVKLLVPVGDAPPRIQTYAGWIPLAAWVRVVAVRCGISRHRAVARESLQDDLIEHLEEGDTPEWEYLRQVCRRHFKDVFGQVLAELCAEDRNLLRFHLVDGLSNDRLAPMFGIHRATAARRVQKLRDLVAARTAARLRELLALSEDSVASLLAMAHSRMELSIERLLPTAGGE